MTYGVAQDAPKPKYIVVITHSEYEQTVQLFIEESNARAYVAKWPNCDVVMARIIDSIA